MKCPYCMEEIQDRALVCRYCGRDFVFVASLIERLSALEHRVDDLGRMLSDLASSAASTGPGVVAPRQGSAWRHIASVAGALIFSSPSLILSFKVLVDYPLLFRLLMILRILAPLAFGLWLGLGLPAASLGSYAKTGVALAVLWILSFNVYGIISGQFHLSAERALVNLAFFVIIVFLFTVGGFVGRWIRKRKEPRAGDSLARRVAESIVPTASSDERVRRVTSIINALAPLLTFAATTAAAYLSYLAAIAQITPSK